MSLSNEVAQGRKSRTLDVVATSGWGRPRRRVQADGITLTVSGDVDGLDPTGFEAAAKAAKMGCPVSKALTGVDITLKVTT